METEPKYHYKFCPRCAADGFFDSSNNSFLCNSCGFQFYLNAAAAVTAVIFNKEDEVLLAVRGIEPAIGMLDLPGGFVNKNETVEHALMREIKEELNLTPSSIEYYGSFPNQYLFSGCHISTVDMVFICKIDSFDMLRCMDDVAGITFALPESIDLNQIAFKSSKDILIKVIHDRKNFNKNK